MKTLIIAEIGVNHNGSRNLAFKLIDAAKLAGADVVKFQTAIPEKVMLNHAKKAKYQKRNKKDKESQINMAKKIHLELKDFCVIKKYCKKKKIKFLSSPFDDESLNELIKLGLNTFKIPSGEITNLPFLKRISSQKKKILLSTGMAEIYEIQKAINTIILNGTKKKDLTILQCNTAYPTPFKDGNLPLIQKYQKIFNTKVGYSDHTLGIEMPIAAVALGATVIEKHFTLDRKLVGPDHKASLEPKEFKKMVDCIRNVEQGLIEVKKPTKSEKQNLHIARKSIVTLEDIKKGEYFNKKNIGIKRPGNGISPYKWENLIGTKSRKNHKKNKLLKI